MTAKECIENGDFRKTYNKWKTSNKRWKEHWFEACVEIFDKSKKWANEFIIDKVKKTIIRIGEVIKEKIEPIIWNCEKVDYPNGAELFYLIKALNNKNELVFSKIGTTTRTIKQRMTEHLKAYYNLGINKIVIDKVYDCGDTEAECYESYFRAKYIKKYPKGTFHKNDRFFGVEFDLNEADKLFLEIA